MTCPRCGQPIGAHDLTRKTLAGRVHQDCPTHLVDLEDTVLEWAQCLTAAGQARGEKADWRRRGRTGNALSQLHDAQAALLAAADRIAAGRAGTGRGV